MELTMLMLFTGTLAFMALIGSVTPQARPPQGALSDLDIYILDDETVTQMPPSKSRIEDTGTH